MIEHGKNNEMSNLDDSAKWVLMFETSITVHRISASRVIKTWKRPSFKTLLLSLIKMHVFSINPNFSIKNIKIHFHSLQINLHNTHIQVQTAITRGWGWRGQWLKVRFETRQPIKGKTKSEKCPFSPGNPHATAFYSREFENSKSWLFFVFKWYQSRNIY